MRTLHATGDEGGIISWLPLEEPKSSVQKESCCQRSYVEQVELIYQANGITEDKKIPVFLSSVGSATYGILWNLLGLTNLKDKPFVDIVAALREPYKPKPLIIVETFHFHR